MKKYLVSIFSVFLFLFVFAPTTQASEGFFELRNQIGESARCHVTSGIMETQKFELLTLCRDIIYPGGTEVFQYVAWASPIDGGNPIRLGTLDLGKQLFDAKEPFNSIFVTKELDDRPKTPTGTIVMQGNLQSIPFLEKTQSNSNNQQVVQQQDNELDEAQSPEPTEVPAENQNNGGNIFRIIAFGGILAFLAIFGVVLVIFVVSRR